jgi:hypothetical protein
MTAAAQPEDLQLAEVDVLHPLIDSDQERMYYRRYAAMTGTR